MNKLDLETKHMTEEEAIKYLASLQSGEHVLSDAITGNLETMTCERMRAAIGKISTTTAQRNEMLQQAAALQQQAENLDRQIASLNGEVGGYSRILVAAEDHRRGRAAALALLDKRLQAVEEAQAEEAQGDVVAEINQATAAALDAAVDEKITEELRKEAEANDASQG